MTRKALSYLSHEWLDDRGMAHEDSNDTSLLLGSGTAAVTFARARDRRRQQTRAQKNGWPVRLAQLRQHLPDNLEEVVHPDADPEKLAQLGAITINATPLT